MGVTRPEASCAASASALRGCCSASVGAIAAMGWTGETEELERRPSVELLLLPVASKSALPLL